jgi:hypothetical protein
MRQIFAVLIILAGLTLGPRMTAAEPTGSFTLTGSLITTFGDISKIAPTVRE